MLERALFYFVKHKKHTEKRHQYDKKQLTFVFLEDFIKSIKADTVSDLYYFDDWITYRHLIFEKPSRKLSKIKSWLEALSNFCILKPYRHQT